MTIENRETIYRGIVCCLLFGYLANHNQV